MKTPLIIDIFDFYGKDIPLQIFSASKSKSFFGAITGALSLLSIGAITVYFLIGLFSRDTKQIISSQSTTLLPVNDLTNMPFLLAMTDPMGVMVPYDAGIYEVYAIFVNVKSVNGNYKGTDFTPIQFRPCTSEDAAGFPLSKYTLAFGMCVPHGKYNLTLNSHLNDLNNGWTSLYFALAKCNPAHNSKCQNATAINNAIEGGYFVVNTGKYVVDNDNNTSPSAMAPHALQIHTSTSLFKTMTVPYVQNLYTDDYGFVFENLVTYNFFTQADVTVDYSIHPPTDLAPLVGGSELIATMTLYNSQSVITTKRTFLKAQAILANIGGVMKFIMVCANLLTQFVVRKNVFIKIGNEVFDYREKNVGNRKRKKIANFENTNLEGKIGEVGPVGEIKSQLQGEASNLKSMGENQKIKKHFRVPKRKNEGTNRVSLKLTFCELLCISGCVRNKKVMNQYDLTQKMILEKASLHSIIRDSYKLDNLSKLTLDADNYSKLKENTHMPIIE